MAALNCCGSDGSGNAVRSTVLLAVTLAASLVLLLVAGIVGNSWLPMINLGAVVLVPMAVIMSETFGGRTYGAYDEAKQAWQNFGSCFFGTILASLLGLPLVLLHVGALAPLPFGLWVGSTVVTAIGGTAYWISRQSKDY